MRNRGRQSIKRFLYDLCRTAAYSLGRAKRYYPGRAKSPLSIMLELIGWNLKNREFNALYYAMGLNLKTGNLSDYIGRGEFLKIKDRVEAYLKNKAGCHDLNYDILCKDKFVAESYLRSNGIRCLKSIGLINKGLFFRMTEQGFSQEQISGLKGKYVIKHITREAGEGIYILQADNAKITINGDPVFLQDLDSILGEGIWLVQDYVRSHSNLRRFSSSALNTTRIVTILDNEKPVYLGGYQVFATGRQIIDSGAGGPVYAGIDPERECLLENGFYRPYFPDGSIIKAHPDSGIDFANHPLPGLKAALELCLKAHSLFYFNFVIGWDVAITEDGPLIVEANEKPGMNVLQCVAGGVRKQIIAAGERMIRDHKKNSRRK